MTSFSNSLQSHAIGSDPKELSKPSRQASDSRARSTQHNESSYVSAWSNYLADTYWLHNVGGYKYVQFKSDGHFWFSFNPYLFESPPPPEDHRWWIEGNTLVLYWDIYLTFRFSLSESTASELREGANGGGITMTRVSGDDDKKRFRVILVPKNNLQGSVESTQNTNYDLRWAYIILCSGLAHPLGDQQIRDQAEFNLRHLNPSTNQSIAFMTNVGLYAPDIFLDRITDLVGPCRDITSLPNTTDRKFRYGDIVLYVHETGRIIAVELPVGWMLEGVYAKAEDAMNNLVESVGKESQTVEPSIDK